MVLSFTTGILNPYSPSVFNTSENLCKSRVSAYLWLESFDRLKSISEATGKPMIALLGEAIEVLAQKYPRKDKDHGEVPETGGQ
jgi:hypothetical protein